MSNPAQDPGTVEGSESHFEVGGTPSVSGSPSPRVSDAGGEAWGGAIVDMTMDERLRMDEERNASQRLLDSVIAHLPIVLTVADRDGTITLSKGGALPQVGLQPGELVGASLFDVFGAVPAVDSHGRSSTVGAIAQRVLEGETVESSTTLTGGVSHRNLTMPLRDSAGDVAGIIGLTQDVSQLLRLEEQLRQVQKMQAVGQLAGGVAHDFNNLLTILSANLEFAETDLPATLEPDHPLRSQLAEMAHAVDRGRVLVQQLLTFSRPQSSRQELVRVAEAVRQTRPLLQRVLGAEISLHIQCDDLDATIRTGAGQIEQVLLNLAVNARDAMLTATHGRPGTGGTLTIEVERHGSAVRINVCDTGHGMDAETKARLFEPFFTTKPIGRGTGLGLATVHGIVQQAGGRIEVASEPGQGTTFSILWPLAPSGTLPVPDATPESAEEARAFAASEAALPYPRTLLLVEDEAAVRSVTKRVLERGGYDVIEAAHGGDALVLWAQHYARIDAVITDCRMPELGGWELARRLRAERPGLPVLYLSGYTDEDPELSPGEAFVAKPFSADHLLGTIASLLRARQSPESCSYTLSADDVITSVDEGWHAFAERDGLQWARSVEGTWMWQHISDETTRHLYSLVFARVRESKRSIRLPLRYIHPDEIREMELEVSPLDAGGLRLCNRVLLRRPRPATPITFTGAKGSADVIDESERVQMCGWCKRVRERGVWSELDDTVRTSRLMTQHPALPVTYGVCDDCRTRILAIVSESAPPR